MLTGSFETTCLSVTLDAMGIFAETLLTNNTGPLRHATFFVTTPSEDDEGTVQSCRLSHEPHLVTVFYRLIAWVQEKHLKFWVCIILLEER